MSIESVETVYSAQNFIRFIFTERMAESKKRGADTDGLNTFKKPKFEKKSSGKNGVEQQNGKKNDNPFHKPGKNKNTFSVTFFIFSLQNYY